MEFRKWSKGVIASSKELRSLYDKAELGMTPTRAGKLKNEVDAHYEHYVNRKLTADFTPKQREEEGVKQIEDDEADWRRLQGLIEKFTSNPTDMTQKASEKWLLEVNNVFRDLQGKEAKASVQRKVQQFCSLFIPDNLALDQQLTDQQGRIYERDKFRVQYKTTKGVQHLELTTDPAGLNERTYEEMKPKDSKFDAFLYEGVRVATNISFRFTPKSEAAIIYMKARQDVQNNWTSAALEKMFKTLTSEITRKQIPLNNLGEVVFWNGLTRVGGGDCQVYDRLRVVEKAIKDYPELFKK